MQASKSAIGCLIILTTVSCSSHKETQVQASGPNPFIENTVGAASTYAKQANLPLIDLAFSSHVSGGVGTCGCAVNPKGGSDRRLNFIRPEFEKAQSEGAALLVVDAGNALFTSPTLDRGTGEAQKRAAKFILKSQALMRLAAQNVGYLDLSAGVDFLRSAAAESDVPLISANLVDASGKLIFPATSFMQENGVLVEIIGMTSPSGPLPAGVRALDPKKTLKAILDKTPENQLILVLSDLGRSVDEDLAGTFDRPMIIVGARDMNSLEIPLHIGKSLLVQPQILGEQWGLLTIGWNARRGGWFNPEVARKYAERWDVLAKEGDGNLVGLKPYSALDLATKSVYEQRLVDMGDGFAAKNELSAEVAAFGTVSNDRTN